MDPLVLPLVFLVYRLECIDYITGCFEDVEGVEDVKDVEEEFEGINYFALACSFDSNHEREGARFVVSTASPTSFFGSPFLHVNGCHIVCHTYDYYEDFDFQSCLVDTLYGIARTTAAKWAVGGGIKKLMLQRFEPDFTPLFVLDFSFALVFVLDFSFSALFPRRGWMTGKSKWRCMAQMTALFIYQRTWWWIILSMTLISFQSISSIHFTKNNSL